MSVNKSTYGALTLSWWDYHPLRRKRGKMMPSIGVTGQYVSYGHSGHRIDASFIACFLRCSFDLNLNLKSECI